MNLSELFTKPVLGFGVCVAFAVIDAFAPFGHRFAPDVELGLVGAGLSVLGVGGAYAAGVQVPTPTKT